MAGLPWFELDTNFHDDPKVRALASRLREPLADSYVSRLYAYCYGHAQDRFEASVAADTVEDACRWRGRRGVLFDALHQVGILERDAGMVVVHGVKARLEPHLAKRVVDKQRQANWRAKAAKRIVAGSNVTPLVARDVTRDVTPVVTRESRGNPDSDSDSDSEDPIDLARTGRASERTRLGPLGSELRRRVEAGIGHGLGPCTQAKADALEAHIQAHGGLEAAYAFVSATYRAGKSEPRTVGWLAEVLAPAAGVAQ